MHKKILLLTFISIYLCSLSPDKNNTILLKEYEIKCNKGLITYKIINSQTKKYFLFIKSNYYIDEYALFEEDTNLSYVAHSYNNYYYPIKSNSILYLVVKSLSKYCVSFKYMDTTLITLKENEQYLHPIVDNKIKYSNDDIYSFISEEKESKIRLEMPNPKTVAAIKYLSDPSSNIFDIYEDTFKCIYSYSDNQFFYINRNAKKPYIFVSCSNSNNQLYNNDILIPSLNNIQLTLKDQDYYILSKGIGCFQILYLEDNYFKVDKKQISFKKTFNILNSETYEFDIGTLDFAMSEKKDLSISIYSSENNFLEHVEIGLKKQDLKIQEKKDQYFYQFKYSLKDDSFLSLNINFNLNKKEYIKTTINIEINYQDGMIYVYSIIGLVFIIPISFIAYTCIKKWYKNKKEKKQKKDRIKQKEMRLLETNQILEKSSFLYDSIQKDYNLLNQACLLCGINDKIPILNDDYESNDNIIINYNNIVSINFIDDINNGKYNSFMEYITPTICTHFYHDECLKEYNNNHKMKLRKTPQKCDFCQLFITLENMQKFGCFFSKNLFNNIFKDKIDGKSLHLKKEKKQIIKDIEKIFYSKIKDSFFIDEIKKEKLLKLKKINDFYLKNFDFLNKYRNNNINYYKYYELPINNDMDKEETELNNEIQKQDERLKKIKRNYERFCREREEEEREIEEEKERRRTVFLKRCLNCRDICLFCKGKIFGVGPSSMRFLHDFKAHGTCIPDDYSCCICGKNKGTTRCNNQCYYCHKSLTFNETKCYYCRKSLNS